MTGVGEAEGPRVLIDPTADHELRRVGYVVLPFLDAAEVADLRSRQQETHARDDDGLVIDFLLEDRSAMRNATELLETMWASKLKGLFRDHRVVVSTFIVKHPGASSVMAMHREPTFVDGDVLTFNTWIPLVDVEARCANGVLRLVPGSERLPEGLVGFNTPPTFRRYEEALLNASVVVDVPAGSVLVYDTRMLHWSEANTSDVPRPAIAASVAPAGVPLIHVVATGRRGRRIYEVDPDFFVDLHPAEVADRIGVRHALLRQLDEVPTITPDDVAGALGLAEPPTARTLVPHDVDSAAQHAELAGSAVAGAVLPSRDVEASAADLARCATGPWFEVSAATAAAADLEAAGAVVDPELLASLRSLAIEGRPSAVLAIDPGGRLTFRADRLARVAGCEGPELRAGLHTDIGVATLTPGWSWSVPALHEVTLWNDGPGPAWAVVSQI